MPKSVTGMGWVVMEEGSRGGNHGAKCLLGGNEPIGHMRGFMAREGLTEKVLATRVMAQDGSKHFKIDDDSNKP